MKVKHNKKRNVGVVFAQLSEYVSAALVEGNNEKATTALGIIRRHYAPGTEVYREFRLFRALMVTEVPSSALAASVISEAKDASKKFDEKKLTQEKSSLIKTINYTLKEDFYSRRVADYKMYATVQSLLEYWRQENRDPALLIKFEKKLHEHLMSEKSAPRLQTLKTPSADRLVLKIMSEKVEEKYGRVLTTEQSDLLRDYVMLAEKSPDRLTKKLESVKATTLRKLSVFSTACENPVLSKNIIEVSNKIHSLRLDSPDDSLVSQYLTVMKLAQEIGESE